MTQTFHDPWGGVSRSYDAAGDRFLASYAAACHAHTQATVDWISRLRSEGIAGATPDDGWVDRQNNTVAFPSYAHFNDGVKVGSKIALGAAGGFRVVTVTEIQRGPLGFERFAFAG